MRMVVTLMIGTMHTNIGIIINVVGTSNYNNEAYEYMVQLDYALNAGCIINNYTPASINELIRNNRAFKSRK